MLAELGRKIATVAALTAMGLLAAGCFAPPPPVKVPAPREESKAPPPKSRPLPLATPSVMPPSLSESELGEGVPTPAETEQSQSAEPPSMLSRIDSSTPPNVAAALRLIEEGRTALAEQAYDRALDRFERAVTIDPANAYGYYFLAQLHYDKHDYDQVIAFADKAVVLSSRTDPGLAARAYSLQGAVYEEVGRYPDARAAYHKALSADAQNLAARVGIARLGGEATTP
jgi:hypothetical protein